MPWKLGDDTVREGRGWVHNNIQHPKTWMRYSDDLKKQYGLTWEDPPASEAPFDNRFYHGRQVNGTLIPKSLADVNEVDADGNPVNDADGNQIVTPGLKTTWVAQTKRTANNKLAVHDWYITRKAEKSTAIPSSVTTYRDAVRTKCAEIETALNGASDLAAFMALFEDERNSDGTLKTIAKINDWPDEI
jgi:hypothetical protein|tara:strand:+ start:793 stop:1359 length:567 start_codon:yes stop_codon:yes gene_type:complete